MKFSVWLEAEASLNAGMPEILPDVNRGTNTPASDEVKRTGLQPQVDSQEIHTNEKDEQDKIQAIDGALKRFDNEIPQGKTDISKLNKFKKMWDQLKEKWEDIKLGEKEEKVPDPDNGLGTATGNKNYINMMQQHPNMVPVGQENYPHGPGIFGQS